MQGFGTDNGQNRWDQLRKEFPGDRILIVSNSSGTKDDRDHAEVCSWNMEKFLQRSLLNWVQAKLLETRLNTKVLIHDTKVSCHVWTLLVKRKRINLPQKPGCHDQVMDYLIKSDAKVDHPNQVVVIGDRLFTDVLMANNMGAHSIWVRHGTVQDSGLLSRMEKLLYQHVLS